MRGNFCVLDANRLDTESESRCVGATGCQFDEANGRAWNSHLHHPSPSSCTKRAISQGAQALSREQPSIAKLNALLFFGTLNIDVVLAQIAWDPGTSAGFHHKGSDALAS